MATLLKNQISLIIILMLLGKCKGKGDVMWERHHLPSYSSKKSPCHLVPPVLSLTSFTSELSLASDPISILCALV